STPRVSGHARKMCARPFARHSKRVYYRGDLARCSGTATDHPCSETDNSQAEDDEISPQIHEVAGAVRGSCREIPREAVDGLGASTKEKCCDRGLLEAASGGVAAREQLRRLEGGCIARWARRSALGPQASRHDKARKHT